MKPMVAASGAPVLVLSDLAFAYGERVLFENLSLAVEPGDKIGIIGDNGVGKSSLLKLVLGVDKPLRGSVALRGGARVGVLEQVPVIAPERTVRDVLEEGLAPLIAAIHEWEAAVANNRDADALMTRIENLGGFDYEHRVQDIASSLGLPPLERTIGTLSGGQHKRVAIGRLALSAPDVVLLDEPTNHLDIETVEWLERWIAESPAACLVVTHDRAFLDNAVTRMAELRSPRRMVGPDAGRGPLAIYAGDYEDYLEARAIEEEQRAALGQSRAQQLKGELEWARRMPKARTTKSQARLGRVDALKDEVRDLQKRDARADFGDLVSGAPRLTKTVVRLERATFGYGVPGRDEPLAAGLDLSLERGERLGVIGRNGIGKTSLLKVIAGELSLWSGTKVDGTETRVAVFDQHRTVLDPTRTIQSIVAPDGNDTVFPGGKPVHVAAWLSRFAFSARHLPMNVSALSGGERNRLALARFLLEPANVLLLDEPTNDLDLATLAVLEEALLAFEGTVVVVSHDRWFLDRIATRLLVFEDVPVIDVAPGTDGATRRNLFFQPGGWTSYRRLRGPELEALREAQVEAAKARAVRARALAKEAQAALAPAAPLAKKVSLSGAEKKELASLEKKIAALESEGAEVDDKLADASVWAGDGREGRALTARKEAIEAELLGAMERWEGLASRA